MDDDEVFQYAEMVLLDQKTPSYGVWKRELEEIIGHTLEPTEATTMYDMISGRVSA